MRQKMARKFEILCIGLGNHLSGVHLRERVIESLQKHGDVTEKTENNNVDLTVVCEDEWLTYDEDFKELSLIAPDIVFAIDSNDEINHTQICGCVLNGRTSWKNGKTWQTISPNMTREPETPSEKPPDNFQWPMQQQQTLTKNAKKS